MTTQLSKAVFDCEFNETLVHQVVNAYMAAARSGNSAQKTRAEVSGGGAKPWKQKGTGRARAGSSRGPLWRSGGVTFASKKRDYSQKVNRKMYRVAMRGILSELNRQGRLIVVDSIAIEAPKTKLFLDLAKSHDMNRGLFVSHEVDENLYLGSRNVKNIAVIDAASIDPVSLVWADKVVLTKAAATQIEELLG